MAQKEPNYSYLIDFYRRTQEIPIKNPNLLKSICAFFSIGRGLFNKPASHWAYAINPYPELLR